MFLIDSNQEYYCRLFCKVCFCICPLSFIQTSKRVLIIATTQMCACANNYWKCVHSICLCAIMLSNALVYILEFSEREIWLKKTSMMGCTSNVAECNFTKNKFLIQTFSNKSSKTDYQWNVTITYFTKILQDCFSKSLYQSSKISPFTSFGTSVRM